MRILFTVIAALAAVLAVWTVAFARASSLLRKAEMPSASDFLRQNRFVVGKPNWDDIRTSVGEKMPFRRKSEAEKAVAERGDAVAKEVHEATVLGAQA